MNLDISRAQALVASAAIVAASACWAASPSFKTKPLWALEKSPVALAGEGFDVPLAAFPDFAAFTVNAKVRFAGATEKGESITLLDQTSGETGWGLALANTPWGDRLTLLADGAHDVSTIHVKPGEAYDFTVASRKGLVVVYVNGRPAKYFSKSISPASRALRVGKQGGTPMKGAELVDLRVFGPKEEYYAPGEPRKPAEGFKVGKGWSVKMPLDDSKPLPRLLYYGDSISHGYTAPLQKLLKGKAHLYHWSGFVYVPSIGEDFAKGPCGVAKYDVVVFNNGLHSLHSAWQKASDEQIRGVYRTLVRSFRKHAPQAKLVYLETTPQTGKKNAAGKVASMGELNYMVLRLNKIADEVMKKEGIPVIPAYSMLADKLEFASGDGYHWQRPAYEILAAEVAKQITK